MRIAADGVGPWDAGLQIERTRLAWQRTSLSGLAFCLVTARLVAIYSWPLALGIGLIAVLTAVLVGVTSARRYRRGNRALHAADLLPGALSFAALTGLVLITGVGAAIYWLASGLVGGQP